MSNPVELLQATLQCREERLDNGLRIVMVEDHRVPAVAVNLWYDVGSRNEVEGRTGFAHLFEHLMFEGSRNAARGEHTNLIQSVGGAYNGSTTTDRTNYFETVPAGATELALWLEADRMGGLLDAVTQECLDNQRSVVKNERRQRIDNVPGGTAGEKLFAAVYPKGHPYHHPTIGYMDDLDAATLDDVHAFFRAYYAPNNAVLGVVGAIDPDQVLEWIQKYFGAIDANPNIVPAPDGQVPYAIGGEVRLTMHDDVGIPQIVMGYRGPAHGTPEWEALALGCRVLCSGRASRIQKRLNGDDPMIFGGGVGPLPMIGGTSLVNGMLVPKPDLDRDQVEAAFYATIDELVTAPPTDEELDRACTAIEGEVLRAVQDIGTLADWTVGHTLQFGSPTWSLDALAALRSITAADISKVAATVFQPDNRVVLTIAPKTQEALAA